MSQNLPTPLENRDFFINLAEHALRNGRGLMSWFKDQEASGSLKTFNLLRKETENAGMRGFFTELQLGGKSVSAMGCLQRVRFKRAQINASEIGPAQFYCNTRFMRDAKRVHSDGCPSGFGYRAILYKKKGQNEYGTFAEPANEGPIIDLGEIGKSYDWALLKIDIYDFYRIFLGIAPLARFVTRFTREAMYTVSHPDYFESVQAPVKGAIAEYCFGYSVLPFTVEKTILGYGPGHLGAAIKQFRFLLLENGDLEIQINFLASPRSEKTLSLFGGFDPGYGLIHLLDAVTFGAFGIRKWAHDAMDKRILTQHGKVHQSLIEGMDPIWQRQNWIASVSKPMLATV